MGKEIFIDPLPIKANEDDIRKVTVQVVTVEHAAGLFRLSKSKHP